MAPGTQPVGSPDVASWRSEAPPATGMGRPGSRAQHKGEDLNDPTVQTRNWKNDFLPLPLTPQQMLEIHRCLGLSKEMDPTQDSDQQNLPYKQHRGDPGVGVTLRSGL